MFLALNTHRKATEVRYTIWFNMISYSLQFSDYLLFKEGSFGLDLEYVGLIAVGLNDESFERWTYLLVIIVVFLRQITKAINSIGSGTASRL